MDGLDFEALFGLDQFDLENDNLFPSNLPLDLEDWFLIIQ